MKVMVVLLLLGRLLCRSSRDPSQTERARERDAEQTLKELVPTRSFGVAPWVPYILQKEAGPRRNLELQFSLSLGMQVRLPATAHRPQV